MGEKQKQSILEFDVSIGAVNLSQKAAFAKNLAVMLKSGLTIVDSIENSKWLFLLFDHTLALR